MVAAPPKSGSLTPQNRGFLDDHYGLAVVLGAGVSMVLRYNPGFMAKRVKRSVGGRRAGRRVRKSASRKANSSKAGKLPKDAVTLMVLLKAREGQESLLEAELRALVGPTRRENGCIRYDLHRGEGDGAFLLHEVWGCREDHRLHTLTPHFVRWNARKDTLLASRDVSFWTQV